MNCELDFPHRPEWCRDFWEDYQRGQFIKVQREILTEVQKSSESKVWGIYAQETPPVRREYYKKPYVEPDFSKVEVPTIKRRGL